MAHRELNLRECRAIEDMLSAKIAVREIAAEIDRHVSTVYREIKRNHYDDKELPELNGYYGVVAQRAATQRRARWRKKRRPHHARRPRGLVFPPDRSIHERPDYVNTRETFGDWEGDLMIFERA